MKRSWLVWIGFSLCLVVTAAAMTWMTCAVVRLDRAEGEARRQAALEENVRLALWRADSTLAPLVTQESLAPWFAFRPFLPNRQPSPFLAAATPHVLVHFQFEPDGRITSPEAPPPNSRRLVAAGTLSAERIRAAEGQLKRLAAVTTRGQLAASLPQPPAEAVQAAVTAPTPVSQFSQQRMANRTNGGELRQNPGQQAQNEFDARNGALLNNWANNTAFSSSLAGPLSAADVRGVPMTPLWVGEDLLLARRVSAAGQEFVQGCLLDWAGIRDLLADAVGDLLPAATFEPVPREADDRSCADARRLAAADRARRASRRRSARAFAAVGLAGGGLGLHGGHGRDHRLSVGGHHSLEQSPRSRSSRP